mgnify:CR=1 FL=1
MEKIIKTENIRKVFRTEDVETWALNGIDIEINEGEFVAIMGPSGCGKSTLYKMIKGTVQTPDGSEWFGTNLDCAYYDQDRSDIQGGKDVESELWDVYPKMDRTQIRNALATFLFRGDDVFKMTDTLSAYCAPKLE